MLARPVYGYAEIDRLLRLTASTSTNVERMPPQIVARDRIFCEKGCR